jgi:threonine dehydrogenase-like Zn-dependent dehydrogenase
VPDGLSPELAGVVTPMANGIQWALFDCEVGYDSRVLIQGPGQQGLSQIVACKQAGASLIIITGTNKDKKRLDVAKRLGADFTINVEEEDPLERINEITSGEGVDVSLDCASGAGTIPVLLGIEALKRKGGTLLIQGEELSDFPNFPMQKVANKYITIKCARGHNFESCELALKQLNSDRFELDLITTHRFGLKDTHDAINAVGGSGDVIHVSLMPWK